MTQKSYSAQQQQIEREIARLRKKAETLQAKRRSPVISQIVTSMREYGITPEEIAAAFNKKKPVRPAAKQATAAKRTVPPKYRHPETGDTWTGRGKPPRWVTDAEQAGTPRDQFLIAS